MSRLTTDFYLLTVGSHDAHVTCRYRKYLTMIRMMTMTVVYSDNSTNRDNMILPINHGDNDDGNNNVAK